jgi:hypothetical protein
MTSTTTLTVVKSITAFTFAAPYSNYKFLFYFSCISYYGTVESGTLYPPSVSITAAPTTSTTFTMTIIAGTSFTYNFLHYTIIVFNSQDIANTKIYK